jgi:nucleoside-diphosphate-sugar epimerase
VSALLLGQSPTIYGDGDQTRDFTYVENVVRANLLALECPPSACGRAYNVACGASISVNELFSLIRQEIGDDASLLKPLHADPRAGDVRDSLASIKLAEKELGYVPTVGVEKGLRATVEWYRSRSASAKPQAK